MINRIAILLILTGAGHLFSVFSLKFISQHASLEQLSIIAQIDSFVYFLISVIALGLQPAAMRDISTSDNWQEEYKQAQKARITLGLVMVPLSMFFLLSKQYLLFAIAPLIALSGEYALYARGYAIAGSVVAFFRLLVPYALAIIVVYRAPDKISYVFLAGYLGIYFLTNLYIAWFLKAKFFFIPRFKSLLLYVKSLPLGIVSLSFYFLGLGILLIAKDLFDDTIIAVAFIGIKFYVIYKGILRIIHQAFIKDMIKDTVCLKIDQLSSLAGLVFMGSVLIFPEAFIGLFFGRQFTEQKIFFMLLGIASAVYSLFLSMATKAMLDKKDKSLTLLSCFSVAMTIICLFLFSFVNLGIVSIALSLLVGELVLAIGLIKLFLKAEQAWKRLVFFIKNSSFLIIPLMGRFFFEDTLIVYALSFSGFILLMLVFHSKKFRQVENIY